MCLKAALWKLLKNPASDTSTKEIQQPQRQLCNPNLNTRNFPCVNITVTFGRMLHSLSTDANLEAIMIHYLLQH